MNEREIKRLLDDVAGGAVDPDEALARLRHGPFRTDDLSFATLDHHRGLRQGLGEVVYGAGKTTPQILGIADRLAPGEQPVLFTRLNAEALAALRQAFPGGRASVEGRTFLIHPPAVRTPSEGDPFVALVCAGTSDVPVLEEAVEVCVAREVAFVRICDVGVSGLHRILQHVPTLQRAAALVVVAGMEGALPSVVAGLVARPVFAVPTSVGYGASFDGLAALLAMLNSCAPGVSVVNIDNGFSAAYTACSIALAVEHAAASGAGTPS